MHVDIGLNTGLIHTFHVDFWCVYNNAEIHIDSMHRIDVCVGVCVCEIFYFFFC